MMCLIPGLWAAKMNLCGKAALARDEDLAMYERKLDFLEKELQRRMELGRQYQDVLERQEQIMSDDEHGRENHQVQEQTNLFLIYSSI